MANFSIDKFVKNFDRFGGPAYAHKFDVTISLPQGIEIGAPFGSRELNLQCHQASLPGAEIRVVDYRHAAVARHLPQKEEFAPLQLSFYCNAQLLEKQLLDAWMDQCVSRAYGLQSYRLDASNNPTYEGTITVNQYDPTGKLVYFAQMIEAFPVAISEMAMDWNADGLLSVNALFSYYKWFNYDFNKYGPNDLLSVSTVTNQQSPKNTNSPTTLSPLKAAGNPINVNNLSNFIKGG